MGGQSQLRQGSVQQCRNRSRKKTPTKRTPKHKQRRIDSNSRPFNPTLDCKVCRWEAHASPSAKITKKGKPHRGHDARCPRNTTTRGVSSVSVQVERVARANIAANNAPPVVTTAKKPTGFSFFHARPTNRNTVGGEIIQKKSPPGENNLNNFKCLSCPTHLRDIMDERMTKYKTGKDYGWIKKDSKYPVGIGLMASYITSILEHRKSGCTSEPLLKTDKNDKVFALYRHFFAPGSLSFKFPKDMSENRGPSPSYHFIEGEELYLVDWKLAFPKVPLPCFNCKKNNKACHLYHERSNFSKRKTLFPIWGHSGVPAWAIVMDYKCQECGLTYAANDGKLLSLLPSDVRDSYPVLPRYASGTWHMHKDLTDDLEQLMKTYANATFVSNKLYRKNNTEYTRRVDTYLSRRPRLAVSKRELFTGHINPPTGDLIREYYFEAENCTLNPYGYSYCDRYQRDMQSVVVRLGDKVAFDWTFQTLKNFTLPGAKAIFTGINGRSKEILFLATVPTTSAKDISHLINQAILNRESFRPSIIYTDTCPANDHFWKEHFGQSVTTKLGPFHLIHRVFDTLDKHSELFWPCLVQLKHSCYTYNKTNEDNLIGALKNGHFNGTKYTDTEIRAIRHSSRWKQRYSRFLRKVMLPGNVVINRLETWTSKFKDKRDNQGRKAFTARTLEVTAEQVRKFKTKLDLISDPEDVPMYQLIPPGKRSTHQLPKYSCDQPESLLEHFHCFMAHYGNTGMSDRLAQTLTMGGTCEHNVKQRWRQHINEMKLQGIDTNIIGAYEDIPQYFDHSYLGYLNQQAIDQGLPPPFKNVRTLRANNGERFLSDYFRDQVQRNKEMETTTKKPRCQCIDCNVVDEFEKRGIQINLPPTKNTTPKRTVRPQQTNSTPQRAPERVPPATMNVFAQQQQQQQQVSNNNICWAAANNQFLPSTATIFMNPSFVPPPSFLPPPLVPPFPLPPSMFMNQPMVPPLPPLPPACFVNGAYCLKYGQYLVRKRSGGVMGKPPHDKDCCVQKKNGYWVSK